MLQVSIEEIARKTASFVERDLRTMLTLAATSAITNLIQPLSTTVKPFLQVQVLSIRKASKLFAEPQRSKGLCKEGD